MKTRLVIFVAALLLLPLAGFLLGGRDWDGLAALPAGGSPGPTAATLLFLLAYTLLAGWLVKLRTGSNPLVAQRSFYLALAATSIAACWLLCYLNLYAASWIATSSGIVAALLDTLLFALPIPAVLVTRALVGSFPGMLKKFAHGLPLPAFNGETTARTFAALAAFGLLGGAALQQPWLLWSAPLPLLLALQLLWHESTILDALKNGDWGRLACAAASGLIVGNLGVSIYSAAGGMPEASPAIAQSGYLLFGLLSLQLGDVVAEYWRRGKTREQVLKKKAFPIPIVVKK